MSSFILYTTVGCHLCDQALALIEPALRRDQALSLVDIADDDRLLSRYGERIPVLRDDHGRELGWPFTAEQASAFINPPAL